ncbi:hypothetical protein HY485_04315 [Candidatus Woesearchaeota archaeon]|nr:hypothetical protein [Candidatus Woesearchaeota archaeon]
MNVEEVIHELMKVHGREIISTLEQCEHANAPVNPEIAGILTQKGLMSCSGGDSRGDSYWRITNLGKEFLGELRSTQLYRDLKTLRNSY